MGIEKLVNNQKRLMGISEDTPYDIPKQTPVSLIQKISDMKTHAENVAHYSEMAARSFKKIAARLKDFESKALESPEILNGESKSLMNVIRTDLELIDNAQERANMLLRSIDFLLSNNFWSQDI